MTYGHELSPSTPDQQEYGRKKEALKSNLETAFVRNAENELREVPYRGTFEEYLKAKLSSYIDAAKRGLPSLQEGLQNHPLTLSLGSNAEIAYTSAEDKDASWVVKPVNNDPFQMLSFHKFVKNNYPDATEGKVNTWEDALLLEKALVLGLAEQKQLAENFLTLSSQINSVNVNKSYRRFLKLVAHEKTSLEREIFVPELAEITKDMPIDENISDNHARELYAVINYLVAKNDRRFLELMAKREDLIRFTMNIKKLAKIFGPKNSSEIPSPTQLRAYENTLVIELITNSDASLKFFFPETGRSHMAKTAKSNASLFQENMREISSNHSKKTIVRVAYLLAYNLIEEKKDALVAILRQNGIEESIGLAYFQNMITQRLIDLSDPDSKEYSNIILEQKESVDYSPREKAIRQQAFEHSIYNLLTSGAFRKKTEEDIMKTQPDYFTRYISRLLSHEIGQENPIMLYNALTVLANWMHIKYDTSKQFFINTAQEDEVKKAFRTLLDICTSEVKGNNLHIKTFLGIFITNSILKEHFNDKNRRRAKSEATIEGVALDTLSLYYRYFDSSSKNHPRWEDELLLDAGILPPRLHEQVKSILESRGIKDETHKTSKTPMQILLERYGFDKLVAMISPEIIRLRSEIRKNILGEKYDENKSAYVIKILQESIDLDKKT